MIGLINFKKAMGFMKTPVKFVLLIFLSNTVLGFQMNKTNRSPSKSYVGYSNEVTNNFIKEVNKEFGFRCVATGGSMPYDVQGIDVGFIAYRKATIEEARELEVMLIEKFLRIINSHEKIRPYLREFPFQASQADISIDFYNKNNEPETVNSISHVSQVKNKIYYDIYDPKTFSSEEVAEESYEDALKIVQEKRSNGNVSF